MIKQKSTRDRRADAEIRRQARRQLVVILGNAVFILVPGLYACLQATFLLIRLNIVRDPLNGLEALIMLAILLVAFLLGASAGALVFEFIMSFYLTIPEWLQLYPNRLYPKNSVERLGWAVQQRFFHWKVQRESQYFQMPGSDPRAKGILQQLDRCASNYTFPILDHGYVYLADTRLSAYRNANDWALIIEVIGYNPRAGDHHGIENCLYCFGTCIRRSPGIANEDFLRLTRDGFDGPTFQDDYDWHVREGARTLYIRDTAVSLDLSREALAGKGIELAEPPSITAAELLRSLIPEQRALLLATDEELYERLTVRLPLALRLDEWHHPDLSRGELPSQSETFRQIAAVLASGDVSYYQPTQAPNTHWRNWPEGGSL